MARSVQQPFLPELVPGDAGLKLQVVVPSLRGKGLHSVLVPSCRNRGLRSCLLEAGLWEDISERLGSWENCPSAPG